MKFLMTILLIATLTVSYGQQITGELKDPKVVRLKYLEEQKEFDINNDGIQDTFMISMDSLVAVIDNKTFIEKATYSDFYKSKKASIKSKNLVDSDYFNFFKGKDGEVYLMIMINPDFSGDNCSVYSYVNDSLKHIFLNGGDKFIELQENDKALFLISRDTPGDVGTTNGKDFVKYPLYKAFRFFPDTLILDNEESKRYNLANNSDFKKYLKMSKPVLGRDSLSPSEFTKLIDLDK